MSVAGSAFCRFFAARLAAFSSRRRAAAVIDSTVWSKVRFNDDSGIGPRHLAQRTSIGGFLDRSYSVTKTLRPFSGLALRQVPIPPSSIGAPVLSVVGWLQ